MNNKYSSFIMDQLEHLIDTSNTKHQKEAEEAKTTVEIAENEKSMIAF